MEWTELTNTYLRRGLFCGTSYLAGYLAGDESDATGLAGLCCCLALISLGQLLEAWKENRS